VFFFLVPTPSCWNSTASSLYFPCMITWYGLVGGGEAQHLLWTMSCLHWPTNKLSK
jgi:hypothetical protein